ncbi:hypothetical protein TRVL_09265 [Trypanosoma vivax]|nr:hypothetical protein TRVL_09265 [Trypanosoma vivax]
MQRPHFWTHSRNPHYELTSDKRALICKCSSNDKIARCLALVRCKSSCCCLTHVAPVRTGEVRGRPAALQLASHAARPNAGYRGPASRVTFCILFCGGRRHSVPLQKKTRNAAPCWGIRHHCTALLRLLVVVPTVSFRCFSRTVCPPLRDYCRSACSPL